MLHVTWSDSEQAFVVEMTEEKLREILEGYIKERHVKLGLNFIIKLPEDKSRRLYRNKKGAAGENVA